VQVLKSAVRASPSAASPVLYILEYRSRIMVLGRYQGWARVQVPAKVADNAEKSGTQVGAGAAIPVAKGSVAPIVGYMYLSALSTKRIDLSTGSDAKPGVGASELVLAGKGFSDAVEATYKATSRLDYSWVDRMEGFGVDTSLCLDFLGGGADAP
jgi:hypothetical protein